MSRSHVWIVEVTTVDGWRPLSVGWFYSREDARREKQRRERVTRLGDLAHRFRVRKYVREER